MASRLAKSEVTEILMKQFDTEMVIPLNSNYFHVEGITNGTAVYVSQSKPSSHSKGNWSYLFFHTVTEIVLERVLFGSGRLVLLNYINKNCIILNAADIAWAIRHSSRKKKKGENEEYVTDFVVNRYDNGKFYLESYNRYSNLKRTVCISQFN
jgi:hypothetical protein